LLGAGTVHHINCGREQLQQIFDNGIGYKKKSRPVCGRLSDEAVSCLVRGFQDRDPAGGGRDPGVLGIRPKR
jgi:hypothetical protein